MKLEAYVGIPFVEKGRSREGCDCWGLLRLVYSDLLGIDLPSFVDGYASTQDRHALSELIAGEIEPWREVAPGTERTFDGVLIMEAGAARHIGLVVSRGLLLHVENGSMSMIEAYTGMRIKRRIAGFYRHESLCQ